MQVIIKETNSRETLTLIDHKSGCNWVQDLIGNADALGRQVVWDDDQGAWLCTQETFDWWDSLIADMQQLDYRVAKIAQMDTEKNIYEVIAYIDGNDLETYVARVQQEIDEAFGEGVGQ